MILVFAVLVGLLVFAIAAAVIGREARRLDAVPPRPGFDMDEAVEWVAEHLPFEVSAVLSHADVRRIIDWNLEYFRTKGVSGNGSGPVTQGPGGGGRGRWWWEEPRRSITCWPGPCPRVSTTPPPRCTPCWTPR